MQLNILTNHQSPCHHHHDHNQDKQYTSSIHLKSGSIIRLTASFVYISRLMHLMSSSWPFSEQINACTLSSLSRIGHHHHDHQDHQHDHHDITFKMVDPVWTNVKLLGNYHHHQHDHDHQHDHRDYHHDHHAQHETYDQHDHHDHDLFLSSVHCELFDVLFHQSLCIVLTLHLLLSLLPLVIIVMIIIIIKG